MGRTKNFNAPIKHKVPWCPWNGCGMPNGATMPHPVVCKVCGNEHTNFDKICPICHTCDSCGRIGKKWWKK